MDKVREVLESEREARLVIRQGYKALVASLKIDGISYRGEGLTVNAAVDSLNANFEALSDNPTAALKERLLAWSEEPSSWYDQSRIRKLAFHGLATAAERDTWRQLQAKYPDQPLLAELKAASKLPVVKVIETSGGNITLEGLQVTSAYCHCCNRSRRPTTINGNVHCSCGNVIAERGERGEL